MSGSLNAGATLPRWIDLGLLPALNLALALAVSAAVVGAVGLEPGTVLVQMVRGAFGSASSLSYTLYYATTFVFTGLAVAVAYHGGHFNIGGEGQATLGGLGAGLVALGLTGALPALPGFIVLPLVVLGAAAFGLAWAAVPAALYAWRGSHVVITTIMFNFLAAALMGWLLVDVIKAPGSMSPESAPFGEAAHVPGVHEALAWVDIEWPATPLNLSLLLALAALALMSAVLWHTRVGYGIRATGFSPSAARYAGLNPGTQALWSMGLAGALAGLVGVNEIAGVHHRVMPDFVAGAGFAGIAVSLIGRNHPVGIGLAALLFGALYQGGAEAAFEVPGFSRDMVFTVQGLVVLFAGAMGQVLAPSLARGYARWSARRDAAASSSEGAPGG
jgi:general nucleoside transport system permease protein